MNLESTYEFRKRAGNRYLNASVFLGDKKIYHSRKVYDFMAFLGDAGGTYESMMLIGTFLHFCLS